MKRPFLVNLTGALALLLGLAACNRPGGGGAGELVLSGNLEVADAQLGFKAAGLVVERTVREGDQVTAGQLIARLDDAEARAQLALRQAELAATEAVLAELEAGSRPQEIAAAAAAVQRAEAERERARLDFVRLRELRAKEVVPERDFETGRAQLEVAEARVIEAQEHLQLLREGPRAETIQQARARVAQARAAVDLAAAQLANSRLLSPLTGRVLSHNIEVGEFVSPGTAVVTVADTAQIWVRAYLNETDLGHVRLGQAVTVRIDTFPDRDFPATIGFIATEAEFTPKTVQTPKERVRLVYRLKIDVANPDDVLKPGMPAEVIISPQA